MARLRTYQAVLGLGVLSALVAGAAPATRPADDVMRPTRRGVRMTPAIARSMSRWWLQQDVWRDLELSEAQEQQVREVLAGRFMEHARARGQEGQPLVEYLLEVVVDTQGFHRDPGNIPEVGQRVGPLVRMTRELLDGMPESVETVLNPEQRAKLADGVKAQRQALDRIAARLKRMEDGEEQHNWNVHRDLEESFGEAAQPTDPREQPMQRVRRNADRAVRQVGVMEWRQLLRAAETTFKFDEAQKLQGEAILAKYLQRAETIMSPEWKAGIREGLVWRFAASDLGDMPKEPWLYRWERAMEGLYAPLRDLGWEFQDEVLAVATPEQWAKAAAELRRYAEDQGLPAGERPGEPQELLARELEARHN